MPALTKLCSAGTIADLQVTFPAVTWPIQATLLTGCRPHEHGVVANGFYWRDDRRVEMWTAGNEVIQRPQVWDRLTQAGKGLTSAAWFPMLSKRCGADFACMPAPVHNPDGTETMWCYTKPQDFYRELLDALGPFPLQHFWGPLANIQSSQWIADSAVIAAERHRPDFFYVYLPHLDYAAQKSGPDSAAAIAAVRDLDGLLERFASQIEAAYQRKLAWLVTSEYAISGTQHVSFPNRLLRESGLLQVRTADDGEHLDLENSRAWALVDHQFAHVFVRQSQPDVVRQVAKLFRGKPGIRDVWTAEQKARWKMDHPRSGDVILVSNPDSWQAYYWWLDDRLAPAFARTVDIHRKPGYDPVELHFDPAARAIPLDASLIRGSHGAPAEWTNREEVILTSRSSILSAESVSCVDLAATVLRYFDITDSARRVD
jgi:predicted AlkP superfamily pyrophosphatase or phosphodiesterase